MKKSVIVSAGVVVLALVAGAVWFVTSGGDDGPDGELVAMRLAKLPDEVDPDAEAACDAFGYPCSWAEADAGVSERTAEMLESFGSQLQDMQELSPREQLLELEAQLLADDDVVMVDFDDLSATHLTFQLDGGLPVYVTTAAASNQVGAEAEPAGDSPADESEGTPDDEPNDEPNDEPTGEDEEGLRTVEIDTEPISYDVPPDPGDTSRTVIIFDPYSSVDGAPEAAAVEAAIEAHDDFVVTHVPDGNATAAALASWKSADAVHVVSHGFTTCPRNDAGSSRCQSAFGLARITPAQQAALPAHVTSGTSSVDGTLRAFVQDSFFASGYDDTVVMINSCQGAGWRLRGATTPLITRFKSAVGWDQNVEVSRAQQTAVRYWELLAEHGLDTQLAYDKLVEEGLDRGDIRPEVFDDIQFNYGLNFNRIGIDFTPGINITPIARLVKGGDDVRVRDVITSFVDGEEIEAGSTIRTVGAPEDGIPNIIEELAFEIEGVENGTDGDVEIRVLIDGIVVEPDFTLAGGTPTAAQGWSDWRVTVENVTMPFDLDRNDVDPAFPTPHAWEAWVSDDGFSTYSSHEIEPVFFSGDVVARGPLPTFTQLGNALPPNSTLEGNELTIMFNTGGGPVQGDFLAKLTASGATGGYFEINLQGAYDAEAGTMSGVATGFAQGTLPFTVPDNQTGTWQADVDFGAGVVEGVISLGGQNEPFRAIITDG